MRCSENRRKRSVEMSIVFEISRSTEHGSMDHFSIAQLQYLQMLENSRSNGVFDNILNGTGLMRAESIRQEKFVLDCPLRTIASLHTLSCGTYSGFYIWNIFCQLLDVFHCLIDYCFLHVYSGM